MRGVLVLPMFVLAVVAGCSAKGAAPAPESTVTGSAALSSYRSPPSAIVATNEAGLRADAALRADGSFSLSFPKGHTYKLAMASPSGEVPLVFPRRSGVLGASFTVKSNGAHQALGTVRYLPGAPRAGFAFAASHPSAVHANLSTPGAPGSHESAHDGDDTEGDAVDDSSPVTCGDGSQGHDDGEIQGAHATGEVDAAQEIAVAEHNLPESIDGCEDPSDGETNDDQKSGDSKD